jgi:hypothetical protein
MVPLSELIMYVIFPVSVPSLLGSITNLFLSLNKNIITLL